MKPILKASTIVVLSLLVMSCATVSSRAIPEKYNFDNELEAVRQISIYDVSSCENVDDQSIILEADRMRYYLLVLRRPIATEYSHLPIGIENTASNSLPLGTQEKIKKQLRRERRVGLYI